MAGEAPLGLKMIFLEDCQVVPDNSVGQTPFHKWRWEKKKRLKTNDSHTRVIPRENQWTSRRNDLTHLNTSWLLNGNVGIQSESVYI